MADENLIQFVGIHDLSPDEKIDINRLAEEYYEKVKRQIKNNLTLKVHVKTYDDDGNRKKYSIHLQAQAPGRTFESSKAHDFDLPKALHKAFQDLEHVIQHKLHTDDQHPRTREPQE